MHAVTGSDADMLAVDGVSVRLAGRRGPARRRFSHRPGEFTGLIGSNGAGKTTLLRVILGLPGRRPGTVQRAASATPPQRPDRLRPAEDPARPRHAGARPGPGRARPGRAPARHPAAVPRPPPAVDEMLAAVDADAVRRRAGRQPVRRRAAAGHDRARADQQPRLLLLDEPLANLDIRSAQEIVAPAGQDLPQSSRVSVLISAHEMNPLLPVMDRDRLPGRAAARPAGPTDEVVRTEVLSRCTATTST